MNLFDMRRIYAALILCSLLGTGQVQAESPRVLKPDFYLQFVCTQMPLERLEHEFDMLFQREGFRTLNQARAQREHGVHLADVQIVGLADGERIIEVTSLSTAKGRFAIRLITRPPTRRASALEDNLRTLVEGKLACEVRQVGRQENPRDSLTLFESEVKRIETLLRKAKTLKREGEA